MFRTSVAFVFLLLSSLVLATTYPMPKPGNDIIGKVYNAKAESGDTLGKLGLRYGMSLHEMMEANPGVNLSTKLRAGQIIVVPAQFILPPQREGIVINMAELRLYYFLPDGKYVMTFPVAMGRDEWRTPTVTTTIVAKEADPVWHVPESIRAYTFEKKGELLPDEVPPGPDNPLGPYALHLGQMGYLIHGNNDPSSIGKFVSSGCIRMSNTDITTLYGLVKVGTPVQIIHLPNKLGWFNGKLYLEAQLPVELPEGEFGTINDTASIEVTLQNMLVHQAAIINWDNVNQTIHQHLGIPELIGQTESWQPTAENTELQPPQAVNDQVVNDEEQTHMANNTDKLREQTF